MESKLKLIVTDDGSHSIYNAELNETYHSFHGAIRESQHVFIENGLKDHIAAHTKSRYSVLEVGFGTGLNALLTALFAEKQNLPLIYHSLEPYPIAEQIISKLNYPECLKENSDNTFKLIHKSSWDIQVQINLFFELKKLSTHLENFESETQYDVIYYDAFAPNKQADIWHPETLKLAIDSLDRNGILVTYCARGQFKRDLANLGMIVESLPGPPGKKEMVRARKMV